MKNPLTPIGIEPATFRFVEQHLNHCAAAVPITIKYEAKLREGFCVISLSLVNQNVFMLKLH